VNVKGDVFLTAVLKSFAVGNGESGNLDFPTRRRSVIDDAFVGSANGC